MNYGNPYRIGDSVIVCLTKRGVRPSPRAVDVRPEPCGEGYIYRVNKFWTVADVSANQLVLITPKGRQRIVDAADPNLHRAGWWERIRYRGRFPKPTAISHA